MKNLILFLVFTFVALIAAHAQSVQSDSIALKVKIAQKDAKKFRLDNQRWLEYRKRHIDYTSDYFKPDETTVSDPTLLLDSSYVKAYRVAAYKKNMKRRTVGHYILIGGGIYLLVSALAAVAIIAIIVGGIK
jgi:hypothetical protein